VRILVTGATGFVGRWLIRELEAAGHEVDALPRDPGLDFARSSDVAAVVALAQPDAVAHLAGVTFLPDAERDPDHATRVNVDGTRAILEALDAARSDAVFLVTSTADVYAPDAPLPINELARVAPRSAYGRSKVAQEEVARAAARGGRPVTIVRAFNHVGPGQRPVFVVPALARRVLAVHAGEADAIPIGDVTARRDFTDVRDVVRAYRLLLEGMSGPTERSTEATVVNVGSGRSVSIEEVLRMLCSIAGVEPVWRVDDAQLRPNEIPDRVADTTLLRWLTGWEPRIPLETSLRDVLTEFQDLSDHHPR
jgi:GDP-4-dehydro-6-deoxy-D-mannose reductase